MFDISLNTFGTSQTRSQKFFQSSLEYFLRQSPEDYLIIHQTSRPLNSTTPSYKLIDESGSEKSHTPVLVRGCTQIIFFSFKINFNEVPLLVFIDVNKATPPPHWLEHVEVTPSSLIQK
ncbi:Uncharacterised protein r2_g3234 [Pycnogonum litorale]